MQLTRTLLYLGFALAPIVTGNPIPEDGSQSPANILSRATYDCPASNNGPGRDYPAKSYTKGQVTAGTASAQKIMQSKGESWQPGPMDYPHFFKNNEKFDFDCGKSKGEYPLRTDGQTWETGQPVAALPDRVIFEYSWHKGKVTTKACGVIRHGPPPANVFLNCP